MQNQYSDASYRQPTVPPSTPPVIDSSADARDAAEAALADGESDAPGSQPAHFDRRAEDDALFDQGGDRDYPGRQPDEIVPGQGDTEVAPNQGDFDRPDSSPIESPPQPDVGPSETPPPPD